jgi:hypothetical protein
LSKKSSIKLTLMGFWRVPVVLTNPADGIIGKVGEIIVDASTGIIERQRSTSLEEIERNAESIAQ